MNFLNDYRSNDLAGAMTGLSKATDGTLASAIHQVELNSLDGTGPEPSHSVSFYRKNPRDVKGDFSYDQQTNIAELNLDFRNSEALINFISASAF